jgi:hypothetical protein
MGGLTLLLLHVYHPDKRPEDQQRTWAALEGFERSQVFPVLHYATTGPDGYWKALEACWKVTGPLVVLEQDIVPRVDQVDELLCCDEPYCAFDFRLAHGVPWSQVKGGHGFGLAKFSVAARSSIVATPQVPHAPWPDTVPLLHERLAPVHVHGPLIEHHHGLA